MTLDQRSEYIRQIQDQAAAFSIMIDSPWQLLAAQCALVNGASQKFLIALNLDYIQSLPQSTISTTKRPTVDDI